MNDFTINIISSKETVDLMNTFQRLGLISQFAIYAKLCTELSYIPITVELDIARERVRGLDDE